MGEGESEGEGDGLGEGVGVGLDKPEVAMVVTSQVSLPLGMRANTRDESMALYSF